MATSTVISSRGTCGNIIALRRRHICKAYLCRRPALVSGACGR